MSKLLVLILTVVAASAAPVCVVATADVYDAAGFECEINGAVFANINFTTQAAADLDASDILVTPVDLGNAVGLRFTGDFLAVGTEDGPGTSEGSVAEVYRFMFDVTRAGSLFTAVTTNVEGGAVVSPIPFFPKNSGYAAGVSVSNDGASAIVGVGDVPQSETNPLFNPRPFITLDSLTTLRGGADFGTASLRSYEHVFAFEAQVPEPATIAGTGFALGLLVVAVRRRRV